MPEVTVGAGPDAGFDAADLTIFCRLDEFGPVVTGQRLEPKRVRLLDMVEGRSERAFKTWRPEHPQARRNG